jgi:SAM-dependent methyltransferase
MSITRVDAAESLSQAWEDHARAWIAWARAPGHDSYWHFHRDAFLALLPPPGVATLDVGCGEGRLPRDLAARGYRVVGVDPSPTLIEAARAAHADGSYVEGRAEALPFDDGAFDLVTAFMTLHDVDDLEAAVRECARVLARDGRLAIAIVHPLNSAGSFDGEEEISPFVVRGSYLAPFSYADRVERDGLEMTFHSRHCPLEAYARALEAAGLAIEAIREPPVGGPAPLSARSRRWLRVPLFLHIRARR